MKTAFSIFGFILFWALLVFPPFGPAVFAGSRITIEPVFILEEAYTDNSFLDDTANAEEDLVTTATAGARAAVESPTAGLRLDYRLGFSRYSRFSENDAVRHDAILESWNDITPHNRISLTNTFRITEEPDLDLSERERGLAETEEREPYEIEAETVRRTRNRYLENNLDFSFSHQFGPIDSVGFRYRHNLLRNEDRTIRNQELHKPSFTISFWPFPNTLQLVADSSYSRQDVENAFNDPGYFEEEVRSGVSMIYWILPQQFYLRGGVEYMKGVYWDDAFLLQPAGEPFREDNWYESLIPSIGFYYRWIPRKMEFEGEVSRERAITYGSDDLTDAADDFETWSGNISVTRFLTRNLDLLGSYRFSQTNFFRDGGENEDYFVHGPSAGFRYRFDEDLPIELTAGFLERNQELSGRETAITVNGSLGKWEFYRRATIQFDVSSGYTDSNFGAERLGFGFFYDAQMILGYRIHRNWQAEFSGYYRKNRFLDYQDRNDRTGEIRDDRIQEYGASLSYQMRTWLALQIAYAYRDVNATDTEDSYTENRVTLRMNVSPTRPIRLY
jgi:hypothetical protein